MRFMIASAVVLVVGSAFAQSPVPEAPAPVPAPKTAEPAAQVTGLVPGRLAHVESMGNGEPTIILIPGLASDWKVFEAFMKRNAHRYTMHGVTLPGFGGSEPPQEPPAGTLFSDAPWLANAELAVVEFIRANKIEKPVVIGHSMGGYLALRLATKHGDLVRSAVSIEGMPAYPIGGIGANYPQEQIEAIAAAWFEASSNAPDASWKETQRKWMKDMVTDPTRASELGEMAAGVPKKVTTRYMSELFAVNIKDELKASKIPTLLIGAIPTGGMSGMTASQLEGMWKGFSDGSAAAKTVIFHDTKHFVMDDSPDQLDAAIQQWIKGEAVEGMPASEP